MSVCDGKESEIRRSIHKGEWVKRMSEKCGLKMKD